MEETGPVGGEKEGRTFRHPEEMKRQRHTTVAAAAGWFAKPPGAFLAFNPTETHNPLFFGTGVS